MQFIVIARDATDEGALQRRTDARDSHIELVGKGIESGQNIMGAAMLDDKQNMCGSVMIVDFASRDELDEWLKNEPYVTGKVWSDIEIMECKVPPAFL